MHADTSIAPSTIMQRLKAETKTAHLELEKLTIPHIKAATSTDAYIRLLNLFYGYFRPVETAIQSRLADSGILPDLAERRQTAAIIADLQMLEAPVTALPQSENAPALETEARALGALYVLEGSTLGGRIISKMLAAQLDRTPEQGISFFNGYGTQTGAKWATFTAALNRYAEENGEDAEDEMIAAANETFSKFRAWIENQ